MKRRTGKGATLPLIVILVLLAACAGSKSNQPTYYYTLDYPSPAAPEFQKLPYVLRVDRFAATPPFDTQRIIYADKGLHRNAYAHFQWIAAPGEMLAFFLGRDLRSSDAFIAVLPPDATALTSHTIKGWVETFLEEDYATTGQAALRLNITLIDARETDVSRRILFQKAYSAKTDCAAKTPAALAEAMSQAAAQVSARMVQDIYDALTHIQNP